MFGKKIKKRGLCFPPIQGRHTIQEKKHQECISSPKTRMYLKKQQASILGGGSVEGKGKNTAAREMIGAPGTQGGQPPHLPPPGAPLGDEMRERGRGF